MKDQGCDSYLQLKGKADDRNEWRKSANQSEDRIQKKKKRYNYNYTQVIKIRPKLLFLKVKLSNNHLVKKKKTIDYRM